MPIVFQAGAPPRAIFSGFCAPDEADALLEWLRATPDAAADLGACESLHTALAQLLIAARVRLAAPPPDALLANFLVAAGCGMQSPLSPPPPPASRQRPARGRRAAGETAGSRPA